MLLAAFVVICLPLTSSRAWSQSTDAQAPAIRYEVAFNDAPLHLLDVTATAVTNGRDEIEFYLPTWTPGSYLIREHARHIVKIDASDPGSGQRLSIRKSKKNRWVVATDGALAVQLRYQIYCNEMSVRTNFVGDDWALLTGAATFLTIDSRRDQAHQVRYLLPAGWTDVVTELPNVGDSETTFIADNYDALVDAPVVAGSPSITSFHVGNQSHRLACVGDLELWDAEAAAKDLQKLVDVQQAFWGTIPYRRYTFVNVIGEGRGGLEHDNSTVVMASRWSQGLPERYRKWLSLCSHEFFHTWNVRRLRPRTLMRYDYESEQLFPELWIAEGITSYYDDLLVRRAGLMTPKEYLKSLSESVEKVQNSPGRKAQSLRDASIDSWIKFYRPNENSINTHISYYTKGLLVAWLLDVEIQSSTDGKRSLDDVMRILYERHAEAGYDSKDFRKVASEVAGKSLAGWFVTHVDTAAELDFNKSLAYLGLHWDEDPDPTAMEDEQANDTEDEQDGNEDNDKSKWDLGITTSERNGRVVITKVLSNGPAAAAGLSVDDELIAVQGYRVSQEKLDQQLKVLAITDRPVEVTIARRGKLTMRTIQPVRKPNATWKLKLNANPSEEVLRNRERWLGLEPQAQD